MNKNKIIFAVIGIIIVLIFVIILKTVSGEKTISKQPNISGFTIWTLDKTETFQTFLEGFKEMFPNYAHTQIEVVGFSNYNEYYNALIGAFLTGRAPDIFVLNNSEGKYFDAQLFPSSPDVASVDTFRNEYDIVFSQDLIQSIETQEGSMEILRGIPLGYQPLGTFYNFRELRGENISTWSYINDLVTRLSQEGKTLLGIGNGSSVRNATDIITQFFLQDGGQTLASNNANAFVSSLGRYQLYGDESAVNQFDVVSQGLSGTQNNVDLFSQGQIHMLFGYPSLLEEIDRKGFNRSFLRGSVFPTYTQGSGALAIDYNYFVINNQAKDLGLAQSIMQYFASEAGQKKYLDLFPYYFPSRLSLLTQRLEQNLKDGYSIKYKDFYDSNLDLVSFYKGNKQMFDTELIKVLDDTKNSKILFENLRKTVLCVSEKMITGQNLGASCE